MKRQIGIFSAAVLGITLLSGCSGGSSKSNPEMFDVIPKIEQTDKDEFEYGYSEELNGMVITAYNGSSSEIYIPDTIDDLEVVGAYLGFTEVTELIMPSTIKVLQFNDDNLKYCNYAEGLIVSSKYLEAVYIPDGVTEISEKSFKDCTSLTSVTIPDSVTEIGAYAFDECQSLTSVTIPDSVTSIGAYAFMGCTGLTSITIPDSVTSINREAFNGCTGLKSVTIPNSVTKIDTGLLRNCTALTSVKIPDSITTIEYLAFDKCQSLTSVKIPNSVTKIGINAFSDCEKIKVTYNGKTYSYDDINDLYDAIN